MANKNRSAEKEEFWRLVLSEFDGSGQTAREFCQNEGLKEASFYSWRREIARRDAESKGKPSLGLDVGGGALLPVNIVDVAVPRNAQTESAASIGKIEVLTTDGMTIRLDASMATQRLCDVLGVIAEIQRGAPSC